MIDNKKVYEAILSHPSAEVYEEGTYAWVGDWLFIARKNIRLEQPYFEIKKEIKGDYRQISKGTFKTKRRCIQLIPFEFNGCNKDNVYTVENKKIIKTVEDIKKRIIKESKQRVLENKSEKEIILKHFS